MIPPAASPADALAVLSEEHAGVRRLFDAHAVLVGSRAAAGCKRSVVARLCRQLAVHARLEEEVFYPAARAAFGGPAITHAGLADHERMKELVEELWNTDPADRRHDVLVEALRSTAERHFDVEEAGLFPKTLDSSMDLEALAGHSRARRREYLAGHERGDPPPAGRHVVALG